MHQNSNKVELIEKAFLETRPKVLHLVEVYLNSKDEAEDIFSATFEALFKQRFIQKHYNLGYLKRWLYKKANNLCIDRIRTIKIQEEFADDFKIITDNVVDIDRIKTEVKNTHDRLLNYISHKDGNILKLKFGHGYTYKELSKQFKTPVGTLKSKVSRNIIKLRNVARKINS